MLRVVQSSSTNCSLYRVIEKCKWSKAPCSGFEPRYFHSGVIYNNKFYYLAGKNIHNYCFNELYQYNIGKYYFTVNLF